MQTEKLLLLPVESSSPLVVTIADGEGAYLMSLTTARATLEVEGRLPSFLKLNSRATLEMLAIPV
jgi:hypothetical protein